MARLLNDEEFRQRLVQKSRAARQNPLRYFACQYLVAAGFAGAGILVSAAIGFPWVPAGERLRFLVFWGAMMAVLETVYALMTNRKKAAE